MWGAQAAAYGVEKKESDMTPCRNLKSILLKRWCLIRAGVTDAFNSGKVGSQTVSSRRYFASSTGRRLAGRSLPVVAGGEDKLPGRCRPVEGRGLGLPGPPVGGLRRAAHGALFPADGHMVAATTRFLQIGPNSMSSTVNSHECYLNVDKIQFQNFLMKKK
eukprot:104806_1